MANRARTRPNDTVMQPALLGLELEDSQVRAVLATCQSGQARDDVAKTSPEMTTISSTKATPLSRAHQETKEDPMLRRTLQRSEGTRMHCSVVGGGLATCRPTRSRGGFNPLGQMHVNQAAGPHH